MNLIITTALCFSKQSAVRIYIRLFPRLKLCQYKIVLSIEEIAIIRLYYAKSDA